MFSNIIYKKNTFFKNTLVYDSIHKIKHYIPKRIDEVSILTDGQYDDVVVSIEKSLNQKHGKSFDVSSIIGETSIDDIMHFLLKKHEIISSKCVVFVGNIKFTSLIEAAMKVLRYDGFLIYIPTSKISAIHHIKYERTSILLQRSGMFLKLQGPTKRFTIIDEKVINEYDHDCLAFYIECIKVGLLYDKSILSRTIENINHFVERNTHKTFKALKNVISVKKDKFFDHFIIKNSHKSISSFHEDFFYIAKLYLEKKSIKATIHKMQAASIVISLMIGARLKITKTEVLDEMVSSFSKFQDLHHLMSIICGDDQVIFNIYNENKRSFIFIKKPETVEYKKEGCN